MLSRSLWAVAVLCVQLLAAAQTSEVHSLDGRLAAPLSSPGTVTVLLFVRSDCPLAERYAPELQRLAREFRAPAVRFWLVFPDRAETPASVRTFLGEYSLPGSPVLDPRDELVRRAEATVAPEAAVFDGKGHRVYRGRIDDRYVDFGKSRPTAQVHDLEDAIQATLNGEAVVHPTTRAIGCALADVE